MKTYSFLICLLVLFFFAGTSCEDKIIDQEFSLEISKLYASTDGHYSVIINNVSDSRCPEGVQCIWQGEVTVNGELNVDGSKLPFEVHSVVSQSNKQPEGYTIQIVDAKPYPKYGTESKPENLIVTLLVKKN